MTKKAVTKKPAAKKASAKKSANAKRISGYGMGKVDVVMSVDQVGKEAAKIAVNGPTNKELNNLAKKDAFLEIDNLCAGYGKMQILHDFTLQVGKGQCKQQLRIAILDRRGEELDRVRIALLSHCRQPFESRVFRVICGHSCSHVTYVIRVAVSKPRVPSTDNRRSMNRMKNECIYMYM